MRRVLRWRYRCVAPFRIFRIDFLFSASCDQTGGLPPRNFAKPLALSLALLAAGPSLAEDKLPQQYQDAARGYASVLEWQGSFQVSQTGQASGDAQGAMYRVAASIERHSRGRFTLKRDSEGWDPARGLFKWVGAGEVTASNRASKAEWYKDGRGYERSQISAGTAPLSDVSFSVWLAEHNASFINGWIDKTFDQTTTGIAVDRVMDGTTTLALESRSMDQIEPGVGTALLPLLAEMAGERATQQIDIYPQVSGGPGVFSFTAEMPSDEYALVEKQRTLTRSRVLLYPVYDDIELEISIADYATWRPLASIQDRTKPGNSLVARATLTSKTGKDLPEVESFKFQLLDTSREPGIAMNFPLDAKDKDYDLRLSAVTDGTLSDAEQTLEVSEAREDDQARPFAEAQIDSYDFGGKSELMVTATLDDGREVIGILKQGDEQLDMVRLPRRLGPDWVAAVWREANQVEQLADDDDDEKVEGQEHNGDGFTLYQEYRGFIENGRHVEGDPTRKDVFVYSFLEDIGRPGIALFGRAAKLRVHGKLQAGEMNTVKRLMNGNHRDAPHRVDQHGICIAPGSEDAGAVGIDGVNDRLAFRPRYASHAYVTLPDVAHSTFSVQKSMEEYGFNEKDAQSMFDRAVAHELLHIVGIDHHGVYVNELRWVYFQGAKDYFNPTKKPRFTSSWAPSAYFELRGHPERGIGYMSRGKTVTLLWEDSRKNLAEEIAPDYERELAKIRELFSGPNIQAQNEAMAKELSHIGGDATFWQEYANQGLATHQYDRPLRIMQANGTESGNELCLMRYYFGNAYEKTGEKNTYYLVRPNSNKVGMELCTSPRGTGANAASHQPQSRAGDAWSGGHRGNCFSQVCPNDAIPPRDAYQ